jgi:hypothetical protein
MVITSDGGYRNKTIDLKGIIDEALKHLVLLTYWW